MPGVADSKTPAAARGARTIAPLSVAWIEQAAPRFSVEAVLETGSTNADLLQRVRQQQPARPLLRAALHQTAGRGRSGRRWFASPGAALLFSLAMPMATGEARIAAATLACGVGAAEALREAGAQVKLKWPNDLLIDGRKLGGVLCELAVDGGGRRTLVVGVGINGHLDAAMRDSIGQPAAALDETPAAGLRRETMIGHIAEAVARALQQYDEGGFVPLQPRFMALFAHREANVDLIEMGVCVASGRALGVDGEGRFLLQTAGGLRSFGSGEVSLRVCA